MSSPTSSVQYYPTDLGSSDSLSLELLLYKQLATSSSSAPLPIIRKPSKDWRIAVYHPPLKRYVPFNGSILLPLILLNNSVLVFSSFLFPPFSNSTAIDDDDSLWLDYGSDTLTDIRNLADASPEWR